MNIYSSQILENISHASWIRPNYENKSAYSYALANYRMYVENLMKDR